ncbi:MAG: toll/interleukin-1 receptor domain-containing protein [Sulfuricurvum sp.]|nr:toll/interleukin-1 receptor domain-containing protein [Sulfuricurvum sp.]
MTTIKEYFDTDAKALSAQSEWEINNSDGSNTINVVGKISYQIDEYIRYWSFYFPENSSIDNIKYIISMPNVALCVISEDEPIQKIGYVDSPERYQLDEFHFTSRILIYIDKVLHDAQKEDITSHGKLYGFNIVVRDKEYAKTCSKLAKPLAFISHDSRDKDSLVRELALELQRLACPVWYDEYSLKVGDNLRDSIEVGLKDARKCIVIISPNFISNTGWTKTEFDSIYTREIHKRENVMLPVWHNVQAEDVYEYSPSLANKVALQSSIGIKELAKKLAATITAPSSKSSG